MKILLVVLRYFQVQRIICLISLLKIIIVEIVNRTLSYNQKVMSKDLRTKTYCFFFKIKNPNRFYLIRRWTVYISNLYFWLKGNHNWINLRKYDHFLIQITACKIINLKSIIQSDIDKNLDLNIEQFFICL